MKFVKGISGNPAGRPKGAKSKKKESLRAWLDAIIDQHRDTLEADLMALDPVERWRIVEKLMAYTLPKMQAVKTEIQFENLEENQIDEIANQLLNTIQNAG